MVLAWALALLSGLPAHAQNSRNAPAAKPAASSSAKSVTSPTTAAQAPAGDALNPLALAALQQGARQCAARIHQVSQFLGFQAASSGALLMPGPGNTERTLMGISIELPVSDTVAYVSSTFAADSANPCMGSYDAVVYWPTACNDVAQRAFGGARMLGPLQQRIQMLEVGPSSRIFLMPAGAQGCVSIKRELIQP